MTSRSMLLRTLASGTVLGLLAGCQNPAASHQPPSAPASVTAATGVRLSVYVTAVPVNGTVSVSASVLPSGADQTIAWASSDNSIADVDTQGLVTGHAKGRATISARTRDGSVGARVWVTVAKGDLHPGLGWSSWSSLRLNIHAGTIEAQADQLANSLRSAGYEYVNVDDGYYQDPNKHSDSLGRWLVDQTKFPDAPDGTPGLKVVADKVHALGLKFGLYVTPGVPSAAVAQKRPIGGTNPTVTCDQIVQPGSTYSQNFNSLYDNDHAMRAIDYTQPGAQAYVDSWVALLVSYGVDYLKLDGVGTKSDPNPADIDAWASAIARCGRPIRLALSNEMKVSEAISLAQDSDTWRVTGGIEASASSQTLTTWSKVAASFPQAASWAPYSGPGGWMDLDSLELVGGAADGLSDDEKKSHAGLWAMAGSEFLLGSDLTASSTPSDWALAANPDLLAIDQSPIASRNLYTDPDSPSTPGVQLWARPLPDGRLAIAFFNLGAAAVTFPFQPLQWGWGPGTLTIRDVWDGTSSALDPGQTLNVETPAHGSRILLVDQQGAIPPETFHLVNVHSSLSLHLVPNSSQGTRLTQEVSTAGDQGLEWSMLPNPDGTFRLVNPSTGLAAVVQSASTANGAAVIAYPYGNALSDNDEWTLVPRTDSGGWEIVNKTSNLALAVQGASKTAGTPPGPVGLRYHVEQQEERPLGADL